ncbi:cob(I)yrinic acid a,c-diamide adenosyltransferase [Blastopirellula sp. JC732]|uniref:Corrinoid adenosyltransferase n=1 Tax=Blastopirellula sediminis TaxID=2894196 RepID=A0A9X1MRJ9_9BACT|nr:cob(I)yrinic acid a,c-diamide adenosyltransferase [Blastopirellula sediminis]MCC9605959.1 cob(I)yrinic acid a,c-diamide adenosyltransferase [Blastopirellula sediminis]MCC9630742.1 cob(I)yrinic acid a,c-diamide adenosyltransferase [Blastopirellula sediminis]
MKIYTKSGDAGETGLYRGGRVRKDDRRIVAIGDVDELNALLGIVHSLAASPEIAGPILLIQSELFGLGAQIASPDPTAAGTTLLGNEAIERLEQTIDLAESQLTPLSAFILPGGSTLGAHLHQARAVCRRAERHLVAFFDGKLDEPAHVALRYLNRLGDLLFVLARWSNQLAGHAETEWRPTTK